jgi:predicted anti-sigma-YlaC factor YlaD
MHKMMLSCEKATTLIEIKLEDKLSCTQNLQLKMHTAMCSACKQYQRQSTLLNDAIKKHITDIDQQFPENNLHLETAARQRIQGEIEKSL